MWPFKKKKPFVWKMWEHNHNHNKISWNSWERMEIWGEFLNYYDPNDPFRNGDYPENRYDSRLKMQGFPERIEPGHELLVKMKSEKIGRFRITRVEYPDSESPEYFRAWVKPLGYYEESTAAEYIKDLT